ncbi:MAG: hypothetical protein ACOZF0_13555 [Thermodesulfobacteriota bacterium]
MDCPKCGYERQPEDANCVMCGLDFKLWEQQVAEKKMMKLRSQQAESPGDRQLETPAAAVPGIQAGRKIAGECPKCHGPRYVDARDCSNCGVIYEKHEQLLAKKKAEDAARKQDEARRFAEEKARVQREAEKGIAEERARREKEILRKSAEMKVPITAADPEPALETVAPPKLKKTELFTRNLGKLTRRLLPAAAILVVIAGTVVVMRFWQARVERSRAVAEQAEAQQRQLEEHQRIAARFQENKPEIIAYLRALIDGRKFDFFEEEVRRYSIPALTDEVKKINDYLFEIKLFDTTNDISADDYQRNFDIFLQLNQMDPENKLYAEKLEFYRQKFAEENFQAVNDFLKIKTPSRAELQTAMACIAKAIELEGDKKEYVKALSALKTAELLFFEGNETVHMALRDDGVTGGATGGQRKIYVWIKNVGKDSFFTNIDFFTMLGKDEKEYKYNNFSRELVAELKPGDIAQGYIYFYTRVEPQVLTFAHINAGTISRNFP